MRKELPVQSGWYLRSSGEISCELERLHERIEALETGRSGPAQLIPKHEQRLDGLEHRESLERTHREEVNARLDALETLLQVPPRKQHVEVYDPGEAVPERHPDALDEAYTERNRLVALLARIYPSGIRKTAIEGWDPCWHNCVFVDTPEGQMSWHYHDQDGDLFAGLPPYSKPWDGHTTPEKYERLARLTKDWAAKRLGLGRHVEPEAFGVVSCRTPEPGITSGIGESWREGYREAINEAFREGRRRERATLIGQGDGVTVIVRDYPALIGDVVSGCKALRATRVLVDAAGPGACVLRALEQAGLPAEALPKGGH